MLNKTYFRQPSIVRAAAEAGIVRLTVLQVKFTLKNFLLITNIKKFSSQRQILYINLTEQSSVLWHGLPSTGKTTAMIFSMISHCNENLTETQVLCFAPTFEATQQLEEMTVQMSKFTKVTCSTINYNKAWDGDKTHILIGTSLELVKLVSEHSLLKYVKLICFDDADFTLPFHTVSSGVLNRSSAKRLFITSSLNKDVLRLSNQGVIHNALKVFKVDKKDLLKIPVDHLLIGTTRDEKFESLLKILNVMRSEDRAIIFSMVRNEIFSIKNF